MIYTVTLNPALDKTVEISGFAPGQVNRIHALRTDPGGKGINVSKVVQSLGGQSTAFGILAGQTGREIEKALVAEGISCCFSYGAGQTRCNLKIVDTLNGTTTDINEPGAPISVQMLQELLQKLLQRLCPEDIVVLSGSVPPQTPEDIYASWTQACGKKGAKVFLDADGPLLQNGIRGIPWLVKPNRAELEAWMGHPLETEASLLEAGRALLQQGISQVVISLGAEGALFLWNEEAYRGWGISVPVRSTVGAGDSMMAALALGTQYKLEKNQLMKFALAVSAANVMCSGTQAADLDAVQELLPRARVEKIPFWG